MNPFKTKDVQTDMQVTCANENKHLHQLQKVRNGVMDDDDANSKYHINLYVLP